MDTCIQTNVAGGRIIHHAKFDASASQQRVSTLIARILHRAPRCWPSLANYSPVSSVPFATQSVIHQYYPLRQPRERGPNNSPRTCFPWRINRPTAIAGLTSAQLSAQVALIFSAQPLMLTAHENIVGHAPNRDSPNGSDETSATSSESKAQKVERFAKTTKLERRPKRPRPRCRSTPLTLFVRGLWTTISLCFSLAWDIPEGGVFVRRGHSARGRRF
jgi:hypothetical protein